MVIKMNLYFVVCCMVLILKNNLAEDPCVDYTKLNDPDRSAAFATTGTNKCDSTIIEGWYRSVSGAGSDIPTSTVSTERCGTQFPIWMDDTLPVNNAEKDVKLCVSHYFGDCHLTITIKAKNCGNFNVYKLKQTSSCPIRYCFGTQLKCPEGQSSVTGFSPGCEAVPSISLSMTVVPGLTDGKYASAALYHKTVKFDCKLDSEPDNKDALRFRVEWFIEDNFVSIFDNKAYSELADTYLSEDMWVDTYTMSFNVTCKMRVKHKDGTMYGPVFDSDPFYAGFKVDSSMMTLKEKETKEIKIWLTVPVGCVKKIGGTDATCFIDIQVWNPKYQINVLNSKECSAEGFDKGSILFDRNGCSVRFERESWDTVKTLTVTGQSDSQYNTKGSRLTYIRLQADQSLNFKALNGASIPDIKVYVTDSDAVTMNSQCKSINDPHMTTFDGRQFENHLPGTFTLHQNKRLSITIQATFTICTPWQATCNCGVAIRNDDAVFIVNFCGDLSYTSGGPTNKFIARIKCDDKYMRITHTGNTYTIQLSTGTTVIIHTGGVRSEIHSIIIKPSVDDLEQSSGLCGYFDGVQSNDFTLRDGSTTMDSRIFVKEWRVNELDVNLFEPNLSLQPSPQHLREYCKCNRTSGSSDILCNLHSAMIPCKGTTVGAQTGGFFKICGKSRTRRDVYSHHISKRDAVEEDDDVFDIIPLTYPDYDNFTETNYTWKNGWNEESAKLKCKDYIESNNLVKLCNTLLPNFDKSIINTVEECALDIKITGDTSFMETSLKALTSGCIVEAKKFENLTTSNSTSGNSSKTLLDDILDESCENNCSGNGLCVAEQCECFDGFYGNLCNLQRSTAPSINKNSNTGLCKTDKKSCRSYGIVGANMIRGSLKCRARHFKLYDDKRTEVNDTVLEFNGTYVNEFSCVCTVPESRRRRAANPATVIADGYHISVSNDGINYSDEITFINYDSTCYECNTTATTCSVLDSCPTTTSATSTTDIAGIGTTTTAATAVTSKTATITTDATATTTTLSPTTTTTSTATGTTEAMVTQPITTEVHATTPLKQTTPTGEKKTTNPPKENNLVMIIAIAIGSIVIIALTVAVGVCIVKKKTAPKRRIEILVSEAPTCTKNIMRPPSVQSAKSIELDFNIKY